MEPHKGIDWVFVGGIIAGMASLTLIAAVGLSIFL
jgi:hypothetical protein